MKVFATYSLIIFLLCPAWLHAQEDTFAEQVFLTTDQQTYLTGEYLWFSAFVMKQGTSEYTRLSKVLYVEILDRENKPVLQTKVTLKDGKGSGSLFLPASLITEVYQLRAYTRWMRNKPASRYFHQWIRIFNPFIPVSPSTDRNGDEEVLAGFFPEGGQLVAGLSSRVAFRVTDGTGHGMPFRGMLISDRGDTVLRFTPARYGIGSFVFTPEHDRSYRAEIRNVYDSLIQTITLPAPETTGGVLAVKKSGTRHELSFTCAGCSNDAVIMEIRNDGNVYIRETLTMKENGIRRMLEPADLLPGINRITLRNNFGILASRLIFVRPGNAGLRITPSENVTGTRQKMSIRLSADTLATVSVSIFKMDALYTPDNDRQTITRRYLSSGLPAGVEGPGYYLTEAGRDALEDMLIVYGAYKLPPHPQEFTLPEYRGQIIEARAEGENNQKDIPVYLSLAGQPFTFRAGLTDDQGVVRFQAGSLHGKRPLVIRPANPADSTLSFSVIPAYSTEYAPVLVPELDADASLLPALESRSMGMQMENIYYGEEKARIAVISSDSLPFYGKPDQVYYLDDYTRFPSMVDVFKEYVYSVALRRRNKSYVFLVYNSQKNLHFDREPLVLLDGVPVMDTEKMINYDPLLIEKIEVITGTYIYGPMAFPGIVSFFTYDGTMSGFRLPENITTEDFDGIQNQRLFFSPAYESADDRTIRKPDMRHLLYWQPHLETSAEGTGEVNFYTSDQPGTYMIRVIGFTDDGRPLESSSTFRVIPDIYSENE